MTRKTLLRAAVVLAIGFWSQFAAETPVSAYVTYYTCNGYNATWSPHWQDCEDTLCIDPFTLQCLDPVAECWAELADPWDACPNIDWCINNKINNYNISVLCQDGSLNIQTYTNGYTYGEEYDECDYWGWLPACDDGLVCCGESGDCGATDYECTCTGGNECEEPM